MTSKKEAKPKPALAPIIKWDDALDIETTPVESSQLHSIGHSEEHGLLAVRFKDFKTGEAKSLYHYSNVGATEFAALRDAESVTAYFRDNIKAHPDRYPCFRIDEAGKVEAPNG